MSIIHDDSSLVKSEIIIISPDHFQAITPDPQQAKWLTYESILTCTGLGRVSDQKQEAGYSMPSQAAEIKAAAALYGMTLNGILKPRAYRVSNRPIPGRVLAPLQAVINQGGVLFVTSQDRLTRQFLEEAAKGLTGKLYVCPLGPGGTSQDTLRSLKFKRTVRQTTY